MRQTSNQEPSPMPGVLATLAAGFELTSAHLWLIILPVVLDVFYWLGPRLSVRNLVAQSAEGLSGDPAMTALLEQTVELASQINVFTSLSLPLIGIPALMNGAVPEKTPLAPPVVDIGSALLWLSLFAGLSLVGLVLTAVYLGLISWVLQRQQDFELRPGFARFVQTLPLHVFRLLGLGVVFLAVLIIVSLPLLPIAVVVGLVGGSLALVVLMMGFVMVATYMSLAVPGVVLNDRPIVKAISESVRLVHRYTLPTVSVLVLAIVIGGATNLMWHLADGGSWLTLISIAGHGFVTTALVAAFFIFYRDRFAVLANGLRN